jgi:hypothetical protein
MRSRPSSLVESFGFRPLKAFSLSSFMPFHSPTFALLKLSPFSHFVTLKTTKQRMNRVKDGIRWIYKGLLASLLLHSPPHAVLAELIK